MKLQKIIYFGKITLFWKSKKYQKDFLYKIWFFYSNIIKTLKKAFKNKKNYIFYFLPLGFFGNMDLKRGSSCWFLNQNHKHLVFLYIVPRGTTNPWLCKKFKKRAKLTHPLGQSSDLTQTRLSFDLTLSQTELNFDSTSQHNSGQWSALTHSLPDNNGPGSEGGHLWMNYFPTKSPIKNELLKQRHKVIENCSK